MGKIIATQLTVSAPAEAVWQTLSDLASYPRWNPFITSAAGTLSVGERLDLAIQPPGGRPMVFKPWVTAVEEHHYVEWLGRLALPGIRVEKARTADPTSVVLGATSRTSASAAIRFSDDRPHAARLVT